MKITHASAEYSELRSTGPPEFGNKRYSVGYVAAVDDGESAVDVRRKLFEDAIRDVKLLHGDTVEQVYLKLVTQDLPF